MTCGHLTLEGRRWWITFSVVAFFCVAFSAEAQATCVTTAKGRPLVSAPQFAAGTAAAVGDAQDQSDATLVGLWRTVFLLGDGPDVLDESFQQFHIDGTEMMLSRGLPPVLGNVCVGIWKAIGLRAYKLKHTAWNWDFDGNYIGMFVMDLTIRLDRRGASYSGTFTADNLTTDGDPIPGQHFEGVVRGARITVD